MRIKSLRLENIRSYISQTIVFPDGRILLAGDIGAGKSTILHAIEFALFGLGELESAALLRHGSHSGSVELTFELNNSLTTIYRQLKRGKNVISQDASWLLCAGAKQTLTPTELKAQIIIKLGYPQEFLTKTKNPVYRYTVYTPQEEMKAILQAKPDERLRILRQLFGIDKYERIRTNAEVYVRFLRERSREFQGMIVDLEAKKNSLIQYNTILATTLTAVEQTRNYFDLTKKALEEAKQKLVLAEQQIADLQKIQQEHARAEAELRYKKDFLEKHEQEHARTAEAIKSLSETVIKYPLIDRTSISLRIKEQQQIINLLDTQTKEYATTLTRTRTTIEHEEKMVASIVSLNTCPVCKQLVAQEHKQVLLKDIKQRTFVLHEQVGLLQQTLPKTEKTLEQARDELQNLKNQEQQALLTEFKHQQLKEKQEHFIRIEHELSHVRENIILLEGICKELKEKIMSYIPAQEDRIALKKSYDAALVYERNSEIAYTVETQKLSHTQQIITQLSDEISTKESAKEKLVSTKQIQHWIEVFFCPLMKTMETHVFTSVWKDFSMLFQQWFSILMQDSLLVAELDSTFTPQLRQNGYDTSPEFLSGGERTAAALAYRLALNKVINDFLHTIQTKDLLILDEPTDGFSDEQLDRVREVLDQLSLGQIIIVSHEQKVEGFVEHIIRVQKQGHESRIVV